MASLSDFAKTAEINPSDTKKNRRPTEEPLDPTRPNQPEPSSERTRSPSSSSSSSSSSSLNAITLKKPEAFSKIGYSPKPRTGRPSPVPSPPKPNPRSAQKSTPKPVPKSSPVKQRKCGKCGGYGHFQKTCKSRVKGMRSMISFFKKATPDAVKQQQSKKPITPQMKLACGTPPVINSAIADVVKQQWSKKPSPLAPAINSIENIQGTRNEPGLDEVELMGKIIFKRFSGYGKELFRGVITGRRKDKYEVTFGDGSTYFWGENSIRKLLPKPKNVVKPIPQPHRAERRTSSFNFVKIAKSASIFQKQNKTKTQKVSKLILPSKKTSGVGNESTEKKKSPKIKINFSISRKVPKLNTSSSPTQSSGVMAIETPSQIMNTETGGLQQTPPLKQQIRYLGPVLQLTKDEVTRSCFSHVKFLRLTAKYSKKAFTPPEKFALGTDA